MNKKDIDDYSVFEAILSLDRNWQNLDECFAWPPDLFLVTSCILKKTGAYRNVVNEFQGAGSNLSVKKQEIEEWLARIQNSITRDEKLQLPESIAKLKNELFEACSKVSFTELKSLLTPESKNLSGLLVKALSVADQACAGLGIQGTQKAEWAMVHYLANLLLVTRGSLSSVAKFNGVVIPKMRTPQTGLTIRSFSLHVSYHDTEVEIMWRTVPWVNLDQNSLNILCVPWPKVIDDSYFSQHRETFDNARYFAYDSKGIIDIDKLVALLIRLNNERCRVHIMVLPEVALNELQHKELLCKLKNEFESRNLTFMPMVIAGLTFEGKDYNAVNLAVYFSGKWYKLLQTKHHRWKLDRNQLIQYELTGKFSPERNWFENITIDQRRLSFFSSNGWLTLCPLICEDLAQLEPVSEIIRGVGPSLLIAVLMDGPQIKERWPARYASIFADDPGTAVLTLTSLGMLKKCSQTNSKEKNTTSVALWKDQLKGWRTIDILDCENRSTALLTVSASYSDEYSADGRSDEGPASVFQLDNVYFPDENIYENGGTKKKDTAKVEELWFGDWNDLRELTNLTFALDAFISSFGEHWDLVTYIINPRRTKKKPTNTTEYKDLIDLLVGSYEQPEKAGINTEDKTDQAQSTGKWPTQSLIWAIEKFNSWKGLFSHWFKKYQVHKEKKENEDYFLDFQVSYWDALHNRAMSDLIEIEKSCQNFKSKSDNEKDKIRIERALSLAIMVSIHNKMDDFRIKYKQQNYVKLSELFNKVESDLKKCSPFGHSTNSPSPKSAPKRRTSKVKIRKGVTKQR
jgi:hypothetical protein